MKSFTQNYKKNIFLRNINKNITTTLTYKFLHSKIILCFQVIVKIMLNSDDKFQIELSINGLKNGNIYFQNKKS